MIADDIERAKQAQHPLDSRQIRHLVQDLIRLAKVDIESLGSAHGSADFGSFCTKQGHQMTSSTQFPRQQGYDELDATVAAWWQRIPGRSDDCYAQSPVATLEWIPHPQPCEHPPLAARVLGMRNRVTMVTCAPECAGRQADRNPSGGLPRPHSLISAAARRLSTDGREDLETRDHRNRRREA